ncbi:PAS domain-containing protein [Anditalea andensis]|uniref:PAS domain-containing protein n=1 Tax=Anditalea andensis TaxID=1048983 RepID=A0A074LNQ2_9BACT|nr:PAS domain-containing protein [Anditalea andensis]KEO75547.1 hypothetical protein EL17_00185 [Anditalea andensis]
MSEDRLDLKHPSINLSDSGYLTPHPLMSWDISGQSPCSVIDFWNIKEDKEQLLIYAEKYGWDIDIPHILKLQYQAIILTDAYQNICWVNKGFTELTGYTDMEAMGRSPRFLQGKNTSPVATKSISKALANEKPFTKKVLNYRKNEDEYTCQLTVYPLFNKRKTITHFLALEVEVEH